MALLEEEDIARHYFLNRHGSDYTVPPSVYLVRKQLPQGGKYLFRPVGLPERKAPIDDNHPDDGITQIAHALARVVVFRNEGQGRRKPKDEGKEMGEFFSETPPEGLPLHRLDSVPAELAQAAGRLRCAQSLAVTFQAEENRLDRLSPDIHFPFSQGITDA